MKKLLLLAVLFFAFIQCNAQDQLKNIFNIASTWEANLCETKPFKVTEVKRYLYFYFLNEKEPAKCYFKIFDKDAKIEVELNVLIDNSNIIQEDSTSYTRICKVLQYNDVHMVFSYLKKFNKLAVYLLMPEGDSYKSILYFQLNHKI